MNKGVFVGVFFVMYKISHCSPMGENSLGHVENSKVLYRASEQSGADLEEKHTPPHWSLISTHSGFKINNTSVEHYKLWS